LNDEIDHRAARILEVRRNDSIFSAVTRTVVARHWQSSTSSFT
jgi:hypothetical protein